MTETTMKMHQPKRKLTAVEAVAAVMADVHAIGKDRKTNAGGTYSYRGIDDVINALAGPMRSHGLVLVPHVVSAVVEPMQGRPGWTNTLMTVEYDVVGPDGSTLPRPVRAFAIGADNGDKGPGKAMSYAYKAAISQLFCIPTDDPAMDNERANIPDPVATISPAQKATIGKEFDPLTDPADRLEAMTAWGETLTAPVLELPASLFDMVKRDAAKFVADWGTAVYPNPDEGDK